MTLALHRLPFRLPPDVHAGSNGQLPTPLLAMTKGGDVLHHFAADAFDAMYDAALRDGITLNLTDGYRPLATQERIFSERYVRNYNPLRCTLSSKVYKGVRYWKLRGVATAAVPGTSNHGWGVAVDMHSAGLGSQRNPGPELRWLDAHARNFGWTWELLPEEPWHLRYFPGVALFRPAPQPLPPPPAPPVTLPIRSRKMFLVQTTNFDGSAGNFWLWDGSTMRSMGGLPGFVGGLRAQGVPFAGLLNLEETGHLARLYGF